MKIKIFSILILSFLYLIVYLLIDNFIKQNNLIKILLGAFAPLIIIYFILLTFMEKIKKIIFKMTFKDYKEEMNFIKESEKIYLFSEFLFSFFIVNFLYFFIVIFNNKMYVVNTIENIINIIFVFISFFIFSFYLIFKLEEMSDF